MNDDQTVRLDAAGFNVPDARVRSRLSGRAGKFDQTELDKQREQITQAVLFNDSAVLDPTDGNIRKRNRLAGGRKAAIVPQMSALK
jgi:hypothetical protein